MTAQERGRIARAIAEAESGTTGFIAVRVVPGTSVEALDRAAREFERHGLDEHEHENAALILVAPQARRYAVIGDRALHTRVGDAFWNETVEGMREYFARGATADAILHAVNRLGEALRTHFSTDERA